MGTAALFTTAQIQKEPPWPLIKEWVKKKVIITGYMHSIEFYASLKTKKIMPFAATGINLEDIILSELSRSHRIKYCMIPLR